MLILSARQQPRVKHELQVARMQVSNLQVSVQVIPADLRVKHDKSFKMLILGRYRHTSSVDAMLTQLEWEPLAARHRTARLDMFYKIHNGLVAIPMPLILKLHPLPTWTENSQAYHIPISSRDYHLHSFYLRTVRDWNILPEAIVTATSSETF